MGGSLSRWCAPCLLAFAVNGAEGQETPSGGLDYRVAPGVQRCPSKAEFSALLSREVGEDPFATTPELGLTVLLTPQTNGVSGVVEITEKGQLRGRRELNSGDCAALAAALALVVGVELDPLAQRQRSGPPPPPTTELQTALYIEPPRRAPQLLVSTGVMLAGGLAPTVVPAVILGLSVRLPALAFHPEFGFEGQGAPPVTAPLGLGGGSGSVSHLLLTGLACGNPASIFGACLLATGGVTVANGQNFPQSDQTPSSGESQTQGYFAAGLRLLSSIPMNPDLQLVVHADAAYQFTREPLRVDHWSAEVACPGGEPTGPNVTCTVFTPPPFSWNIGFALQGRIL
jgi:hypothetical protein